MEGIDSLEGRAETIAFDLAFYSDPKSSNWSLSYGPQMSAESDTGVIEYPAKSQITREMLEYWSERALQDINPFLRSRYADLVWVLSKPLFARAPDIKFARVAIDSTVEVIGRGMFEHTSAAIYALKHALNLAISIKDHSRLQTLNEAVVDFEASIADDTRLGTWGFSFDFLIEQKNPALAPQIEERIIARLEDRLARLIKADSVDPHGVAGAALRLAHYYRAQARTSDVTRVLELYSATFRNTARGASPLVGSTWLADVHETLINFGLSDQARVVEREWHDFDRASLDHLKSVTHSVSVPNEAFDQFIESFVKPDLNDSLVDLAIHFTPRTKDVVARLKQMSSQTPLLFMIQQELLDNEGRTVATIGSLEEDLEGHLAREISNDLHYTSVFLQAAIDRILEVFSPSASTLLSFMQQSAAFVNNREKVIERGLSAYLERDYTAFICIVVPQIEAMVRRLVRILGAPTRYRERGEVKLRQLGSLLRDSVLPGALGEDNCTYLRVLLVDSRGWNSRNTVCHGLLDFITEDRLLADRLLHCLLFLSLVRTLD